MAGKKRAVGNLARQPVQPMKLGPRDTPPKQLLTYVVCPLCGMSRKLERTGYHEHGAKGQVTFAVDLEHYPFIELRQAGGRIAGLPKRGGSQASSIGFPRVSGQALAEIKATNQYLDLRSQIISQCRQIISILQP